MSSGTFQRQSCHEKHVVSDRLCYFRPKDGHKERSMAEELSRSLRQSPRSISPKFFYDRRGSELFEQICGLPEYYLTRAEIEILSRVKHELPGFLDGSFRLVELGSGSSVKTRHILDALEKSQPSLEYVPIDISEFLEESASDLLKKYPELDIVGIIDTYENGLRLVKNHAGSKNLIAFFGSSFGNFSFREGAQLLKTIRGSMGEGDLFLIGLDLVKERDVLEGAYDDEQGITAQFNLNVLERINSDLGANFELDNFSHHSVYNEEERRVEMYLRSLKEQSVSIPKANLSLDLGRNELIHTENSHKFSIPQIDSMMTGSGFEILRLWQDSGRRFAMLLLAKNQASSAHLKPAKSHLSSSLKKFL